MADDDIYEGLFAGRPTTGRLVTGQTSGDGPRPMTSVKAAGYQSKLAGKGGLDSLQRSATGPAPPLADKADHSPEEKVKEMELKVHSLVEASAAASAKGDVVMALERAKEAGRRERAAVKYRETHGLADSTNMELTYCVCFNLAHTYHLNKMYNEAINTYSLLVKNKQYPQSGRLRVNMGNIYYEDKKYTQAVKMYRMALDQIQATSKDLRRKIQRNIGNAFVKMGQFQDAIQAFEAIMEVQPEFQAGFNLTVCYYALGDVELMMKSFRSLLQVPLPAGEESEEGKTEDDEDAATDKLEISRDVLKDELKERQKQALQYVTNAAKLIAPVTNADWVAGYNWVIEQLKLDHQSVASQMQIEKALQFMAHKQFDRAIEELKAFEKKEVHLKAKAATNLSFLYFLEGDMTQASKYANLAVRHDRYNAKALVNMGNCLMDRGELERAKELYLEAIGVEADCVEAIFNLGLVNKHLGVVREALQAFEKLHTLVPSAPEVIYQIASLYEMMEDYKNAQKYFSYLITSVPTDAGALLRLGKLVAKEEDEAHAFHYYNESYRYYPVNLEVISWLGVYYVKTELYEKAIEFFERAAEIQPNEVKWKLMVAACYRRMMSYAKALELYESIHEQHPENLECLRYLVTVCKELNRRSDQYEAKLVRLERISAAAAAQQQATEAPMSSADEYYPPGSEGSYMGPASGAHSARDRMMVGNTPDRFAAPTDGGIAPSFTPLPHDGAGHDEFADADLSDLLTE